MVVLERSRHREAIPALASDRSRPFWSVMIPTYNCARHLRHTLASVLAQDPGPGAMQIEVVDDCSAGDDPHAVVRELGEGRVGFYRQPQNQGHVRNFNTCLRRSIGEVVHLLHGDDYVRPGFYERMTRLFESHSDIGMAFCRHVIVDGREECTYTSPLEHPESGVLANWLPRIAGELPMQPPSVVVRRRAYEKLGGFDGRLTACGEDWEMWVRLAAHYPVGYEPEVLAVYRDNDGSLTKRSIRSGQNIRDVRKAIAITGEYLPEPILQTAQVIASESWADWALDIAGQLLAKDDLTAAAVQVREAVKCSRSKRVITRASRLLLDITLRCGNRLVERPHR